MTAKSMSDAVLDNIRVMRSKLAMFAAAVPPFMDTLIRWRQMDIDDLAGQDYEWMESGMSTTVEYFKMVEHVNGNFDPSWWKSDPGALVAYGYKLLLGDRLIDHTEAASILFDLDIHDPLMKQARITLHQKYLYPKRGQPTLTAYCDPDDRVHGARVDIMEVKALAKELVND